MLEHADATALQLNTTQLAGLYRLAVHIGACQDFERTLALALEASCALTGAHAGVIWNADAPPVLISHAPIPLERLQAIAQTPPIAAIRSRRDVAFLEPGTLPGIELPALAAVIAAETEHAALLILLHPDPAALGDMPRQTLAAALPLLDQAIERAWQLSNLRRAEANREQMINLLVHDIRSPLVATHASIEVTQRLLSGSAVSSTIGDALQTGLRSVRSAVDLCNDMLEVKRLQAGYRVEKHPIQAASLLGDVAMILKGLAAQRGGRITQEVSPPDLMLRGDLRLLERVLINLVTNALRFIPDKGFIEIRGAPDPTGEGVLLAVSDNGPGIPPAERERIFQPFAQGTGEMRRGTGLGLYFCRQAVDAHGGSIWVEERPGGGCIFVVRLPG